jgi:hypothetical protein
MTASTHLESSVLRSVVGLRLRDSARGVTVTEGMDVRVLLLDSPGGLCPLSPSPQSGVFGAATLPGFEDYVAGRRPATDWWGSMPMPNAVVLIDDRAGRFLPVRQLAILPLTSLLTVLLDSGPARAAGGGLIPVRLQLAVSGTPGMPAAWAQVTVALPGVDPVSGTADARGAALVLLPAAAALPPLVGSPPHSPSPVASGPGWPATITVHYDPSRQRPAPGARPGDPPEAGSRAGQRSALLVDVKNGPLTGQVVRTASLGQDLVVATVGASELFVVPP